MMFSERMQASKLHRAPSGMWAIDSGRSHKNSTRLRIQPGGLRFESNCRLSSRLDPLAAHAEWLGPSKIVRNGRGLLKVTDLVTGPRIGESTGVLDPQEADEQDALLEVVLDLARRKSADSPPAGWAAPESDQLRAWLREMNYESQVDDKGDLRLTLNRQRRDGAVRLQRSADRVRLALVLCPPVELEGAASRAVRDLAEEFNNRTSLVRIAARRDEDHKMSYEAQVDLTGLPFPSATPSRLVNQLWKEMLAAAVSGLDLALWQLALELPLLANPAHGELVEILV